MERAGDRQRQMEGYCATGQSPHWAVAPLEEEEEEEYLPSNMINSYRYCLSQNTRYSKIYWQTQYLL